MGLDDRPANGGQGHQSYLPARQVLFVVKRSITRHQNVETRPFRGVQQFAILQPGPPQIRCGECVVMLEVWAQIMRHVGVE